MRRRSSWILCAALTLASAACGASGGTAATSSGAGGSTSTSSGAGGSGGALVAPAPIELNWYDRTKSSGLLGLTTTCRAVSFGDFDNDGDPDIVIPDAPGMSIYRNDGAGHFTPWVKAVLPDGDAADLTECCGTAVADLDRDGFLDVVIGMRDGNRIAVFYGDGKGGFTPMAFGTNDNTSWCVDAIGVLARDDGPTRLFVGRYANVDKPFDLSHCALDARGANVECQGTTFPSTSVGWKVADGQRLLTPDPDPVLASKGFLLAAGVADLDGDGRDDAVIGRDFGTQLGLRATSTGFEDASAQLGIAEYGHGMGVTLGDTDGDGQLDLVITTLGGLLDYQGLGAKGFKNRGAASRLMTGPREMWPWAALFDDLDNDGELDLFVVNEYAHAGADPVKWLQTLGGPADFVGAFDQAFFHEKDGSYTEARIPYEKIAPDHGRGVSLAIADVDGDGRDEIVLPVLRASDHKTRDITLGVISGRPTGHGLTVQLGHAAARPGTRVTLTCAGKTQTRVILGGEGHVAAARFEAHFGCGSVKTYEGVHVEPRGKPPVDLPGGMLDKAIFVDVP